MFSGSLPSSCSRRAISAKVSCIAVISQLGLRIIKRITALVPVVDLIAHLAFVILFAPCAFNVPLLFACEIIPGLRPFGFLLLLLFQLIVSGRHLRASALAGDILITSERVTKALIAHTMPAYHISHVYDVS